MTDKATVEISSPVTGVVTFRVGEPGEVLAVGTEFVGIEIEGSDPAPTEPEAPPVDAADPPAESPPPGTAPVELPQPDTVPVDAPQPDAERQPHRRAATRCRGRSAERRPTAAPAVRARAAALGIDLSSLTGSGPDGRVVHADLDRRAGRVEPLIGCVADRCGDARTGGRTTRP